MSATFRIVWKPAPRGRARSGNPLPVPDMGTARIISQDPNGMNLTSGYVSEVHFLFRPNRGCIGLGDLFRKKNKFLLLRFEFGGLKLEYLVCNQS